MVALTGAGCSTESGIPDYRGPKTRHQNRTPIQYGDFVAREAVRRRYWARSFAGWPRMAGARPNPGHLALAALERAGAVCGVITQNVDRLHHAAGSERVIELHGALAMVRCLDCGEREPRAAVQQRLGALTAAAPAEVAALAPDGDAELALGREDEKEFPIPACLRCGGVLKPDVVLFGENVPRPVVDRAWDLLGEGDVLLVVGSSLTVFSGYRFVRRAAERGMPVAIVNLGPTRGDPHAQVRVDARAGVALPALARALTG